MPAAVDEKKLNDFLGKAVGDRGDERGARGHKIFYIKGGGK